MPTVGNPQIFNIPTSPGFLSGGAKEISDVLLQALLSGQLARAPGPTTQISPAEQVAPGQPGAGSSLAGLLQNGAIPQGALGGYGQASYTPGTTPQTGTYQAPGKGLQLYPSLDRQLKQSEIAKNQSMAKMYGTGIPLYDASGTVIGTVPHGAKAVPGAAAGGENQAEKQFTDRLTRILSNRSGGLGLQDAKVNQAIHLRQLIDQYHDPKTGAYNIPAAQYKELAIGLASLVSNNNAALESTIHGIEQRTAKGDYNGALSYVLGTPKNANTQAVIKNLVDSIDRQGQVSEKLRDKYLADIHKLAPKGLSPERLQELSKVELGSSYKDYLAENGQGQVDQSADPYVAEARRRGLIK